MAARRLLKTAVITALAITGCEDANSGAIAAQSSGQVAPGAVAFVDGLYSSYTAQGSGAIDWLNPEAVFEPELAAAIARLVAEGEETMMMPDALAADPLCQCQDWGEFGFEIAPPRTNGERVSIAVTISNFGESKLVDLALVETQQGWRIYDIGPDFRASVLDD